jgi:uncharacterized protein (TIGR03437 family)
MVTKSLFFATLIGVLLTPALQGQNPAVAAATVVNAAHYITTDFPNGGIAHGGMFILKSSFSGACGVKLANSFPLQANMNGTSIKVTMAGASYDALMVYVVGCSARDNVNGTVDQLAAIMPSNVPVGAGSLTVTYNGKTSTSVPVKVIDRGFGMFTINQGGTGPAIVQNYNSATDTPTNTLANSAKPNQVAILWGTGLGPDGNPDANAPKPTDIPIPLEFYVGGVRANVAYKGRSGCCSGIDQIVFTVPDGLSGCYVPVVVNIGGMVSNFGTMAVAPNGGPCSDARSFSSSDIQTAQSSGHLRVGFVDLIRTEAVTPASPGASTGVLSGIDFGWTEFADLPFTSLIGLPTRISSVPGSCLVLRGGTLGNVGNETLGPPMPMDNSIFTLNGGAVQPGTAGAFTFVGPSGTVTGLTPGASDNYISTVLGQITGFDPPLPFLPDMSFLVKGNVSISAPGGNYPKFLSVGSVSTQISVPDAVTFTNRYSLASTLDRTQSASVSWTGANGPVLIWGTSASALASQPGPHADFYCLASGSDGQFTIPGYVLASLPPSIAGQVQSLLTVGLGIGQIGTTRFSASGIDAGFLRYNITFGRVLGWK